MQQEVQLSYRVDTGDKPNMKTVQSASRNEQQFTALHVSHNAFAEALTPFSLAVPPSTTPATRTPGDPAAISSSWIPKGFGSDTRTKLPSLAIMHGSRAGDGLLRRLDALAACLGRAPSDKDQARTS